MTLQLELLGETLVICRLPALAPLPDWAVRASLSSITRTADELSIVCLASAVPKSPPEDIQIERGWRCFRVRGTLDFKLTGVLASLVQPLADAGISLFALSTYNTDYVLVKGHEVTPARRVLAARGHTITTPPNSTPAEPS